MSYPPPPHRRPALGFFVVLAALALASAIAGAQATDVEISASSAIELVERADSGSYQRFTVSLASVDGVARLVADKDGARVETEVPQEEYLALWHALAAADLRSLGSPDAAGAVPDQSRFTVTHRLGSDAGGFTVYGVDSMSDTRYRDVVRAILALGNRHLARAQKR